jgi:hypothetical protein
VRLLLLIPHLIVITLLTVLVTALQFVLWVPVLLVGRYPKWGYYLVGGYVRWSTRLNAYLYGLTDAYPPFQLKN